MAAQSRQAESLQGGYAPAENYFRGNSFQEGAAEGGGCLLLSHMHVTASQLAKGIFQLVSVITNIDV